MANGTFYGVSVGPGDPELLTLKALRIIKKCPVLAVPKTKNGHTVALDIVLRALDLSDKTILSLSFPMTRDEEAARENHGVLADRIAKVLRTGQDVAMLCLGDVSVYSTVSYLAERVKAKGFSVELVPGVPSFCAAAAKLQRSLTEKSEPLHILPAGYPETLESLSLPGTKVLMKPGKDLTFLLGKLEKENLLNNAAMVINCGMEGERAVSDLTDFDETETGYFTTILIGRKDTETK